MVYYNSLLCIGISLKPVVPNFYTLLLPLLLLQLSTIESLLGSTGTKVLFGMLTQPEEGAWYLEDLGALIRLDLSHAHTTNNFFTEGCQVVVQGEYSNSVFHVVVSFNQYMYQPHMLQFDLQMSMRAVCN